MWYSAKRQGFLVEQGYTFKVISELQGMDGMRDLVYPGLTAQLELLNTVLMANLGDVREEEEGGVEGEDEGSDEEEGDVFVSRKEGRISGFSGGDSMAYMEIERSGAFGRKVAEGGRRRVRKG
jgi:DNA excision repair protein ERCC-3